MKTLTASLFLFAISISPIKAESLPLLKEGVAAQYKALKEAATNEDFLDAKPKDFRLAICLPAEIQYQARNPQLQDLAFLAMELTTARRYLSASGYPERSWKPALDNYERRQLAYIKRHHRESRQMVEDVGELVTANLERDKKRYPRLPPALLGFQRTCGDYHVSVSIVTHPPKGKVKFRPAFYERVCQRLGKAALDFRECNSFNEAIDGESVQVSGAYTFEVIWPDGRRATGQKDFGPVPDAKAWIFEGPKSK